LLRDIKDNELHMISDDPVRPHLPANWRTESERRVWVLEDDNDSTIRAIICVAFTEEAPITEHELDYYSQAACQDDQHGQVAVFYTVWSYSKGAGREIIIESGRKIKQEHPYVKRMVTLSPLTEMAEKFHLRNGAKFVRKGQKCQNFEYDLA